ncbi:MAG: UDP-3-O-(3-hydroxymyristoyl)glucosamine N-acyltransferase [Alphaproteobacteria bacterium]|nr:UDP-3-O-(3-hydroxymyristoyl)glucosamine N-acyltransferase [Alphaproteobacteria bacterium]
MSNTQTINRRFFKKPTPLSLSAICEILGISPPKAPELTPLFDDVSPLDSAEPSHVSCFHNAKYLTDLQHTKAGLCIVSAEHAHHVPPTTIALVIQNPYRAYGKIAQQFYSVASGGGFISEKASISKSAQIGLNCTIGDFVTIGDDVVIGDGCQIKSFTSIESGCILGNNCVLESNVTISHSILGNDVFIKPGAKIGQPGFGFHMDAAGHFDIPQLGQVVIRNNVHIGANTTIDRGSLVDTVIGNGVRIDNLVQIAHNVVVGDNSVLVAQAGIAGSSKLGQFVIVAGQVGIAGHLTIGDGARIAAQSGIMKNIAKGETIAGAPGIPIRDWHRQTIALNQLIKGKK